MVVAHIRLESAARIGLWNFSLSICHFFTPEFLSFWTAISLSCGQWSILKACSRANWTILNFSLTTLDGQAQCNCLVSLSLSVIDIGPCPSEGRRPFDVAVNIQPLHTTDTTVCLENCQWRPGENDESEKLTKSRNMKSSRPKSGNGSRKIRHHSEHRAE